MTTPDLRTHPAARQVRKRPLPVQVRFARVPGCLTTLEDDVRYVAGDALLTGTAADSWPVQRARFLASYEATAGTEPGADGTYCKRPVVVLAVQLSQVTRVRVGGAADFIEGQQGDWLVQYAPGEHGVVGREIFDATYDVLS